MRAVFLEYAWDMGWCDPCAADPLSADELKSSACSGPETTRAAGQNVFVTRLHVRYDAQHFPEDLVFQQTGDRENFQGRYVLRHAWTGGDTCPAATDYKRTLSERREKEAQTLLDLTGWRIEEIRKQASLPAPRRSKTSHGGGGFGNRDEGRRTKDEGRRTKDEWTKCNVRRVHRPQKLLLLVRQL